MNDRLSETPTIEESQSITIPKWATRLDVLASKMGVKLSRLMELKTGTLQEWDIITITRLSDGSGIFKKERPNYRENWWQEKYSIAIPKEALYQNIESWPQEFPFIKFRRNPEKSTYTIEWSDIEIPTIKLEDFKAELIKVSWPFITECWSRKAQYELACTVENWWSRWDISLDQVGMMWWASISTTVWLHELVRITKNLKTEDPRSYIKLGIILAKSLPFSGKK
jgi:hypothetical protein